MILLNDFARQWKVVESRVLAAIQRVGSSGRYILGPEVAEFEKALAEFWGVSHAVGVGNGMDALEIALRCLDLRPGEKVLTTPLSAFATTLAILRGGGVPVFVDVDDNGNLDLDLCRETLKRDRSIRFMLPVHLYGNPLDLEKLTALKADYELIVVEDCAQAIGARHGGRTVGSVGQASGTSFYPTKNLGALGDGGALLTNDPAIAERAKTVRNYGQTAQYLHQEVGLNSRLDEIQAAVLREAFLPMLPGWIRRRTEIASKYQQGIRNDLIKLPPVNPASEAAWHLFPTLLAENQRDRFRSHLKSGGILTGIHYPRSIPAQPACQSIPGFGQSSPAVQAASICKREVSLPIHPFLTDDEVERVIAACNQWQP